MKIQLWCSVFCLLFVVQSSLARSQDDLDLKLYEVDDRNTVLQTLATRPNRDVILEETVGRVRFECQAPFPVQWIYRGNGVPALSSSIRKDSEQKFSASAFIPKLKESHSGQYECSSTSTPLISAHFFLYVPGPNIFTFEVESENRRKILIPKNDTKILIPCAVSHPEIRVTLEKLLGDVLVAIKPISSTIQHLYTFDPRTGFTLDTSQVRNPEGTYACTGFGKGSKKTIEFDVSSRHSTSTPAVFQEKFDISSAPLPPSAQQPNLAPGQCATHTDCAPTWACYTDFACRDPCTYSIRCGVGAICRVQDRRPFCECPKDFIGDPTKECFSTLQGIDPREREPLPVPEPPTTKRPQSDSQCKLNHHCALKTHICLNGSCLDACAVKICDRNAYCVTDDQKVARCVCNSGFSSASGKECAPERLQLAPVKLEGQTCVHNRDCVANSICVTNSNGRSHCGGLCGDRICGENASCRVGKCVCAQGTSGDPFKVCYADAVTMATKKPEICSKDEDCANTEKCLNLPGNVQRCVDACTTRRCGFNLECRARSHFAECVCPKGFTGSGIIGCTKVVDTGADFESFQRERDLALPENLEITKETTTLPSSCASARCGPNAECRVVGNQPTCFCLANFIGKPPKCRECNFNIECSENHVCVKNRCTCIHRCGG